MRAVRRLLAALLVVAGCGVRAPAPLDVAALVARHGAPEARRELTIRVLEHPRDVQARLALAALAEQTGRPSEAIEQLEAVLRLGGPLGTRWHADDRARLGRLLLARGRVRLARGAATALADLERARSYGALPSDDELEHARAALAITQLRHVSTEQRAKGRASLAALAERDAGQVVRRAAPAVQGAPRPTAESRIPDRAGAGGELGHGPAADAAAWRGARADATPAERGAFGAWAWSVGARREAYEQLAAWHAATRPPRDPQLQGAYLRALAWWSPVWLGEAPLPPAEDLVGPGRCWFPGAGCTPAERGAVAREAAPTDREAMAHETAPTDREAVTRESARTDREVVAHEAAPTVTHETAPTDGEAERRASSGPDDVPPGTSARAVAAARYARARSPASAGLATLARIASAYARDPSRAERLGRDLVAESADAAAGHAAIAALFDALGDPARARSAWQAAVAASEEPAFVRGLAEAVARGGDGPAALVYGTQAAAAWGDPAVAWIGVAHALLAGGQNVDALTAASNALDLAGPAVLPAALDAAIAASRALGRTAQVNMLQAKRARLESLVGRGTGSAGKAAADGADPDAAADAAHAHAATAHADAQATAPDAAAAAALSAHRARPTAATTACLWVLSRARPRDVELRAALVAALGADDPRRATIVGELISLAGDPDPQRALAAVNALPR